MNLEVTINVKKCLNISSFSGSSEQNVKIPCITWSKEGTAKAGTERYQ